MISEACCTSKVHIAASLTHTSPLFVRYYADFILQYVAFLTLALLSLFRIFRFYSRGYRKRRSLEGAYWQSPD